MDVFSQPHPGRIKLEIELTADQQEVILPDWIDATDVTGDERFSNAMLSRKDVSFPHVADRESGQDEEEI